MHYKRTHYFKIKFKIIKEKLKFKKSITHELTFLIKNSKL